MDESDKSMGTVWMAVDLDAARCSRTSCASAGCGAVNAGTPGFMMPALCQAISSIVLPSMPT